MNFITNLFIRRGAHVPRAQILKIWHRSLETAENERKKTQKFTNIKSFLYVGVEDAQHITRIVNPDYDDLFAGSNAAMEKFRETLRKRCIPVDFDSLRSAWQTLHAIRQEITTVESARDKLNAEIQQLNKDSPSYEQDFAKITSELAAFKKQLKTLKIRYNQHEELFMLAVLNLPNFNIHESTPLDTMKLIYEHKSKPNFNFDPKDHIEIGLESDNLFRSPFSAGYYLKNEAAVFELQMQKLFSNILLQSNFMQFSNPDIFKPVVIEGSGFDVSDPYSVLMVQTKNVEKSLYLSGSASLSAFCSYFTRMNVRRSHLPFRQFTLGRCYLPCGHASSLGLINSLQSTRVHFFIVTENTIEAKMSEYNSMLQLIEKTYKRIGLHFQIVHVPLAMLSKSESLRTSIRMFSPALKQYVEVAYISLCDDYISRRLTCYHFTTKKKGFLSVVHGDIVNISHLLALAMENTQNENRRCTFPQQLFDNV